MALEPGLRWQPRPPEERQGGGVQIGPGQTRNCPARRLECCVRDIGARSGGRAARHDSGSSSSDGRHHCDPASWIIVDRRSVAEQHLDSVTGKLLQHQELIGVCTRQPVPGSGRVLHRTRLCGQETLVPVTRRLGRIHGSVHPGDLAARFGPPPAPSPRAGHSASAGPAPGVAAPPGSAQRTPLVEWGPASEFLDRTGLCDGIVQMRAPELVGLVYT